MTLPTALIIIMQFQLDEVVWAKIEDYPWWPAVVTGYMNKITKTPKNGDHYYKVNFFGEQTQYPAIDSALLCMMKNYRNTQVNKKRRTRRSAVL